MLYKILLVVPGVSPVVLLQYHFFFLMQLYIYFLVEKDGAELKNAERKAVLNKPLTATVRIVSLRFWDPTRSPVIGLDWLNWFHLAERMACGYAFIQGPLT